ncbi:SAM-dependent methyltransferase [Streptosporangium canum]|uniref:SAM-dependent methyltransferase n=1 Tax=Streptosporangium canum TaxID=324952 RepID=UPI0037AB4B39
MPNEAGDRLASSPAQERPSNGINVANPNIARIQGYLLGGKDNYCRDRETAEKLLRVMPDLRRQVQENRAFLGDLPTSPAWGELPAMTSSQLVT